VRVRVLADDLTGAADAGVAFAPAWLLITPDTGIWLGPAPTVVLDSATRDGTEDAAAKHVRTLTKGLLDADIAFKKIDSTLRGHLVAELAEVRTAAPDAAIVLAPAFPRMGRTIREGVLHVDGRPAGPTLRDVRSRIDGVLACDASTDDDLDRIVAAGQRLDRPVIWVGSGGLAKALARTLLPARPTDFPRCRRFLAIIGSPHAVRQTDALAEDGATIVEIPVAAAVSADRNWTGRIADSLSNANTVVRLTGPRHDESARVAAGLAAICASVVPSADLLVLAGGETARAVLTAGGISDLEILAEPDPGIVLSATGASAPTHVMTKAGSFGDDDALRRALRRTMIYGKGQQ
jgi:uncharacterized protein YgbK (DUF1537 family)